MRTHSAFALTFALTAAGLLAGCGTTIKIDPAQSSRRPAPDETVATTRRNGPPAHATAVGLRRKYQYLYYPHTQVYYAPDRDQYAWLDGGDWRVGINLPPRVLVKLDHAVQIEVDDREPWVHQHHAVLAQYPEDWTKDKGKAKGHAKHANLADQQALVSD